jgi:hypothetical protein
MNREQIYQALFDKLATVPGIKTKSRKLKHWTDVPANQQPALFQAQRGEVAATTSGTATRWTLNVDVYVYVNTSGAASPSTGLNNIIDGIEAALAPDNPIKNTNTLGGLVVHCRIEGGVETDEGTLGDQAAAIIPIVIYHA